MANKNLSIKFSKEMYKYQPQATLPEEKAICLNCVEKCEPCNQVCDICAWMPVNSIEHDQQGTSLQDQFLYTLENEYKKIYEILDEMPDINYDHKCYRRAKDNLKRSLKYFKEALENQRAKIYDNKKWTFMQESDYL